MVAAGAGLVVARDRGAGAAGVRGVVVAARMAKARSDRAPVRRAPARREHAGRTRRCDVGAAAPLGSTSADRTSLEEAKSSSVRVQFVIKSKIKIKQQLNQRT